MTGFLAKRINTGWIRRLQLALLATLVFCFSFGLLAAEREIRLSQSPTRLFETPFYLSVPTHSWLEDKRLAPGASLPSGEPVIRLPTADLDSRDAALRLLVMRDNAASRATAAKRLFEAG